MKKVSTNQPTEPENIPSDIPIIEVTKIEDKETADTFADKVINNIKRTRKPRTKRPTARGKKIDVNLFSKLLPTLVATFAATYSRQLTPDPYKNCAPSAEEVSFMIMPLFNILSRSIEITGEASETVLDLINAAIASIIFGTRSYITYAKIKESRQNERSVSNDGHGTNDASTKSSNEASTNGGTSISNSISFRGDNSTSTDDINSFAYDNSDDKADARREAALFSQLYNRDIEGRVRLGMLPPRISE